MFIFLGFTFVEIYGLLLSTLKVQCTILQKTDPKINLINYFQSNNNHLNVLFFRILLVDYNKFSDLTFAFVLQLFVVVLLTMYGKELSNWIHIIICLFPSHAFYIALEIQLVLRICSWTDILSKHKRSVNKTWVQFNNGI